MASNDKPVYFYTFLNQTSGHGQGGEDLTSNSFARLWRKRHQVLKKSKRDDKFFPIDQTIAITIDGYGFGDNPSEFGIVYAKPEYKNYVDVVWFSNPRHYESFMEVLNKYYETNEPQRGKYV